LNALNTCIQKVYAMPTSVRLAPETEQRIDRLVTKTGRSKAYYLRELIERGMDDLEDIYLGQEVLERIRKGEERTYTLAEVERELGLSD
jgi:RHH-type transcriptional regulator, rel operon repressor / antitoxin RelB